MPFESRPNGRFEWWEWVLIVLLLLGAFALRVANFTESPPGVSHDEVLDWYNFLVIRSGEIRALYPHGGGRETLFIALIGLTLRFIGANLLALRLPSLALGMAGVAGTFVVARRLFGRLAGYVAAAGIATSYWALTMSRLGERTGSAPVMALIATTLFLRLFQAQRPAVWRYGAAGVMLGVALYTYPAALMLPPILLVWTVCLVWLRPDWLKGKWGGLAFSALIAGVVVIPLAQAWLDPAAAARADAVDAPLEALLAGDPGPTLANVPSVLGMLTIQGDPGLDVNNDGLPVYPTLMMKVLFYAGFLVAIIGLARESDPYRPGYALALIWLAAMLVPTLVTQRALNPSRTIGLLGIAFVFPAVAAATAYRLLRQRSGMRPAMTAVLLVGLALAIQLQHTAYHYYTLWPANPVVRFLYQANFRAIALDLDARPDRPAVAVGGLTPYQMDPASMILLMDDNAYAEALSFFDPTTSLLLPVSRDGGPVYVAIPQTIPLHPLLLERLPEWGVRPEFSTEEYTLYVAQEEPAAIHLGEITYAFAQPEGGEPLVRLVRLDSAGRAEPGQTFTVFTCWQANRPSDALLRIFIHLTDPGGALVAQSDVLGAPSTGWRRGDLIIQAHDITLPAEAPPGPYSLRIGVYDPEKGTRLMVATPPGGDFVEMPVPSP